MTISDVISKIEELNEDAIIYARRHNGKFFSSSEAVLLELTEEEQELSTNEIADKYCPGLDYFLEVFLVKEMAKGFHGSEEYKSLDKRVDRIIHYAEFDA